MAVARKSIFRGKDGGDRYQGEVTPAGAKAFEAARGRLAKLVGRTPDGVSDADTMEYLARGDDATRAYLKSHPLE